MKEFLAAISSGDLRRLVSVLSDEVVLYADGGGNANAALRPVRGALHVARFLLGAIGRSVPKDVGVEVEHVNGQPGLVYRSAQGTPGCVLAFEIGGERIGTNFVVTNPDKLTASLQACVAQRGEREDDV